MTDIELFSRLVLGYFFALIIGSMIAQWPHPAPPPPPPPPVQEQPSSDLATMFAPPSESHSPIFCTPLMSRLHIDDCPLVLR